MSDLSRLSDTGPESGEWVTTAVASDIPPPSLVITVKDDGKHRHRMHQNTGHDTHWPALPEILWLGGRVNDDSRGPSCSTVGVAVVRLRAVTLGVICRYAGMLRVSCGWRSCDASSLCLGLCSKWLLHVPVGVVS